MFAERDRTLAANRDGEYILWFEADRYDQLQIIQILVRLADLGVPAQRITLICIGEHPGIARFGGLGDLTAAQLRALRATNGSARLTPGVLQLATDAWAAFRRRRQTLCPATTDSGCDQHFPHWSGRRDSNQHSQRGQCLYAVRGAWSRQDE